MSELTKQMEYPKGFNGLSHEQIVNLDIFIEQNVGLTKEEIIKNFKDYKFTLETLEWMLYVIENHPITFQGIGPFLEKDGRIYNIKKKKNDTINVLVEENTRLKYEIKELKEILESREEFIKEHCM